MRKFQLFHAAGLVLAVLIVIQPSTTQQRPGFGPDNTDDYDVTCQSHDGQRKRCGNHPGTTVRLSQQLSRRPCIEGQNWGMDGATLWVDQYCGATFTFSLGSRGGSQLVTCQSTNGRKVYCGRYPGMRVTLERQLSRATCVENRSWGTDNNGLWTDNNCGANFRVEGRDEGQGRGGRRPPWWDRESGDIWPPRGTWRGRDWNRGGACFYKAKDFGGQFFCMQRGEQVNDLEGDNDEISSMRMFGGARVTIFEHNDFRGNQRVLTEDVRNFQNVPFSGSRNWNDRISSIRVD